MKASRSCEESCSKGPLKFYLGKSFGRKCGLLTTENKGNEEDRDNDVILDALQMKVVRHAFNFGISYCHIRNNCCGQ